MVQQLGLLDRSACHDNSLHAQLDSTFPCNSLLGRAPKAYIYTSMCLLQGRVKHMLSCFRCLHTKQHSQCCMPRNMLGCVAELHILLEIGHLQHFDMDHFMLYLRVAKHAMKLCVRQRVGLHSSYRSCCPQLGFNMHVALAWHICMVPCAEPFAVKCTSIILCC